MNTLTNKPKFWQRPGFKPILMLSLVIIAGFIFTTILPNISHAAGLADSWTDISTFMDADWTAYGCDKDPNKIIKLCSWYLASMVVSMEALIGQFSNFIISALTFDTGGGILSGAFTTVRNACKTFMEAGAKPIGFALVGMFFLIQLLEHSVQKDMTMESFLRMFTKLAVGVVAVQYSDKIFDLVFQLGQGLSQLVNSYFGLTYSSLFDYAHLVDNMKVYSAKIGNNLNAAGGISWLFSMGISGAFEIIMMLFMLIMLGCAFFISFTRMFEICLRGMFLPLGLALLAENGWNGGGGRYFKKYLACCSKIMVLVAVAKMTGLFMAKVYESAASAAFIGGSGSVIKDVFTGLFAGVGAQIWACVLCLFIGIAGVGMMFKTDGLVNDIFGA